MPNNLTLDLFVAGQALLDVGGGPGNAGLDVFVAGQLYETIETGSAVTTGVALAATQAQSVSAIPAYHAASALTASQAQVVSAAPVVHRVILVGSLGQLFVGI